MIRNKNIFIIMLSALMAFLPFTASRGTINSVSLSVENPTTLSNNLGYYLAGKTYSFTVNVIDPDITGWAELTDVRITIANTPNIIVSINPSGTGVNLPVTVVSGSVNAVADVSISGALNNCTVTFKVTFRWDTPVSVWAAGRNVIGSATTSVPGANTRTDTRTVSYGVCSSVRVLNFAQSGVAADGRVNPWHDAFNVSGVIIYDVPGAGIADRLETVTAMEINGAAVLIIDGNPTALVDGNIAADEVDFNVTQGFVNTLGNHTWRVRLPMATGGATVSTANGLTLNCDRVEITGITFFDGGGVDAPAIYRSVNHPGTRVRVTARMQNGGGAMVGNTTVTVYNINDTLTAATVLIAGGQTSGVADLAAPGTVVAGTTVDHDYRIETVTGGAYGGDLPANGQNASGLITQPANPTIYWDNADPPGGAAGNFTGWGGFTQTAFSLTFNWTALTTGLPDLDGDFYTYRVYYKENASATWLLVDRNTTGFAYLGALGAGTISATIDNLRPVTNYDYYITAVDVFGNEVVDANRLYFPAPPIAPFYGTESTVASTINVSITDGITLYEDKSFTDNPLASARPLRKTAIRVSMFIVGVDALPDEVNIIGIPNVLDPSINGAVITAGVLTGAPGVDYFIYSGLKVGPNQWNAYIPDTSPLIDVGKNTGFILELIRGGVKSYADHNSELEDPAIPATVTPNDYEWAFTISSAPKFTPWPTRILNNVITRRNPLAYPSFYLTDDAYVTIKAYDIKGRVVDTLLDKGFRNGGQNIKEGGWRGSNRSGKKLGPGLYYINIKARRASDGRVILNENEKVVVAR